MRFKTVTEMVKHINPQSEMEEHPKGFSRHVSAMIVRLEEEKRVLVVALKKAEGCLQNIYNYGALRDNEDWEKCDPVLEAIQSALAKEKGETE